MVQERGGGGGLTQRFSCQQHHCPSNSVDRWSTKEVERQGVTADGNVKRRLLGEEIVKAIRFPVMSQKEFASFVLDCDILTKKEIGFMMKNFSNVSLESSLPFISSPRLGILHRSNRMICNVETATQEKITDSHFWIL